MKMIMHGPCAITKRRSSTSLLLFAAIALLVSANLVFSSRNLWFCAVLVQHYPLLAALPLVPEVLRSFVVTHGSAPLVLMKSYRDAILFFGSFIAIFILYFWALYKLPRFITERYILCSTFLLGLLYVALPIVTSQDILSYIAYGRMAVFYHLNPMTTSPQMIHNDYVYSFLYWINQPSIYGPTWIFIVTALQWLALVLGFKYVLSMEIMLRIFSLCMHLGSTILIWRISYHLYDSKTHASIQQFQVRRLRATLAFAWNPFLLFEACVNAHNDITILFFLLLAIWLLFPSQKRRPLYPVVALLFSFIVCLKFTYIILLPGLLLFLWTYQASAFSAKKRAVIVLITLTISIGVIVCLYMPFWQGGRILDLLKVTPTTSRAINSVYDFFVTLYAHMRGISIQDTLESSSWLEVWTHHISTIVFSLFYGIILMRTLLFSRTINRQATFISWLAFTWLLFCLLGSPWFWPWYSVILFGLFALLEVRYGENAQVAFLFGKCNVTLFGLTLSVSLFSLYCFGNLSQTSPQPPLAYLGGIWIWGLPCLVLLVASYLFKKRQVRMEGVEMV